MRSNGSPYSLRVHVDDRAMRTPPSVHAIELAWLRLNVCPISWANVRNAIVPFRYAFAPPPRPDQPQSARGHAKTNFWNCARSTPEAASCCLAAAPQALKSLPQFVRSYGMVNQPKTVPVSRICPYVASS